MSKTHMGEASALKYKMFTAVLEQNNLLGVRISS